MGLRYDLVNLSTLESKKGLSRGATKENAYTNDKQRIMLPTAIRDSRGHLVISSSPATNTVGLRSDWVS